MWVNKMKLGLFEIGKIKKAEIDLEGITVVCGETAEAKLSISKALFAVVNGCYDLKERVEKEIIEGTEMYLKRMYVLADVEFDYAKHIAPLKEEILGLLELTEGELLTEESEIDNLQTEQLSHDRVENEISIREEKAFNNANRTEIIDEISDSTTTNDEGTEKVAKERKGFFKRKKGKHAIVKEEVSDKENSAVVPVREKSILEKKLIRLINEQNIREGFEVREKELELTAMKIEGYLKGSEQKMTNSVLELAFKLEFGERINSRKSDDSEGHVLLGYNKEYFGVKFVGNRIKEITVLPEIKNKVMYISSPFMLENIKEVPQVLSQDHYSYFYGKLKQALTNDVVEDRRIDEKSVGEKEIMKLLDKLCPGELTLNNENEIVYFDKTHKKELSIREIAPNIKMIGIIRALFEKNIIEECGTLIIDEPENFMHPKEQVQYAKMLILANRIYDFKLLINTNSIYIIRAVEKFASEFKTEKRLKFYLEERKDGEVVMREVTGSVNKVYEELHAPIESL